MRIFREIICKENPSYDEKNTSLDNCCKYIDFNIDWNEFIYFNKASDKGFMVAWLVESLYEKIDLNKNLFKDFDYNNQECIYSHYYIYKKQKMENMKR